MGLITWPDDFLDGNGRFEGFSFVPSSKPRQETFPSCSMLDGESDLKNHNCSTSKQTNLMTFSFSLFLS
ncbi:hypothetical protein I7I50_09560 [Histoplasma capsulatum G186AR]|uniref:Uncharacterized protein n=1 Tax=Ajellomyces capsulatus TaxID=5037 RepID=A0A8H8D1I0_AJECA|nr:hypothetical protein I7I52_07081 [Histoplasma capsulatum]QSS74416.1 hypothetical protein I7I50_09560 [Histoplasma capsulatum G186AR]